MSNTDKNLIYDTDEKEEDMKRKTIIREELKENDK